MSSEGATASSGTMPLTIADWKAVQDPDTSLNRLLALVQSLASSDPAWISIANNDIIKTQWQQVEANRLSGVKLPLYGVPFAVKDNIDTVGFSTTAACPDFAFQPSEDATCVKVLKSAGAIVVGKTNLDSFATGLVGTRSQYGAVPNTFDPRYVSGGSSSGSASVVARCLVPFALGTDTAGSGRVPAGFNNVVGLKGSKGALSTKGVLPACRTLDCVTILALTIEDASTVFDIAAKYDPEDAYSRKMPASPPPFPSKGLRVAICENPPWFGDKVQQAAYKEALGQLRALPWALEPVDFSLLFKLASLLYEGPWVAERYTAIKAFMENPKVTMDPTVRSILSKAKNFSATDFFEYEYLKADLIRKIETQFASYDAIIVPTTPTFPTIKDLEREPILENSKVGTYTNFVNFMDWTAISVPAGFRSDGLPFGITIISTCWQEPKLLTLGAQWLSSIAPRRLGALSGPVHSGESLGTGQSSPSPQGGTSMPLVVVGAHLTGQPLNYQLTEVGGQFRCSTQTSPMYRLHSLAARGSVRKPGLQRVPAGQAGAQIAVEVWDIPSAAMGAFLGNVSSPLAIGSIELADGSWVKGFVCESYDLVDAQDITSFGGWVAYLASLVLATIVSSAEDKTKTTEKPLFGSVLVANRGEIAVRIISTLRKMGIKSIAVYSKEDRTSPHVRDADAAYLLEGNSVADTYLSEKAIVDAAKAAGAEAIIPGYGFLSESASFAQLCEANGMMWIGPTPQQMRNLGLKAAARSIAQKQGVPLLPGTGVVEDLQTAVAQADAIGYPVIVKSNAGGGGIGLQQCSTSDEVRKAVETVSHMGRSYFNDGSLFIEKYVEPARHVEVQIIGDGKGLVRSIGERDCSLQRRKQKVIEEGPAVFVPESIRKSMREAAVKLAAGVSYRNVGTVEFIYDVSTQKFYFLEVNTRLQVEHPVTEATSGLDLVEAMLRVASGQVEDIFTRPLPTKQVAIEARIYGESPLQNFRPSPGQLTEVLFPAKARVDTWVELGTVISPNYDPLLAKLIVTGNDRPDAVQKLSEALESTLLYGVETNLDYLKNIVKSPLFLSGEFHTTSLSEFSYIENAIEFLDAGGATTMQDYPGRIGYWHIGIPPSGPMDDYSFRLANRILGNPSKAAALECTQSGPTILFHGPAAVAVVGGGSSTLLLDGVAVPYERAIQVKPGQKLTLGVFDEGCRAYIAFRGGLLAPEFMASKSTFAMAQIGGTSGRLLRQGDIIHYGNPTSEFPYSQPSQPLLPKFGKDWSLRVIPGPHGSPDYFSSDSFQELFTTPWRVHHNSNRIGVRLTGPKPQWARQTGGEAGLHPSNIHDSPYSIGSISFTGDEAVILSSDGPSLGGFVVFAVITEADMWKVGQLKPGYLVHLRPVTFEEAKVHVAELETSIDKLHPLPGAAFEKMEIPRVPEPVVQDIVANNLQVRYRPNGDRAILLEFGEDGFDIRSSVVIYSLMDIQRRSTIPGIVEMTPGVRSMHVIIDSRTTTPALVAKEISRALGQMASVDTAFIPSRTIRMPFVVDHATTLAAVERYGRTIRPDAPWLPSNTAFLQKINALSNKEDVGSTLLSTTYLVLGLGDVFCGSPCAIPLDPRQRMFGMKYNPNRSYTAEGTVGVGGQYICIYAVDSPGGYQLTGRTTKIWHPWTRPSASSENPWLFNVFDQIKFYPVEEKVLDEARASGTDYELLKIEEGKFDVGAYEKWLKDNETSIKETQDRKWKALHESELMSIAMQAPAPPPHISDGDAASLEALEKDPNVRIIRSSVAGKCFKCTVEVGDTVESEQTLVSIEAMKMELEIKAPSRGKCVAVFAAQGMIVDFDSPMVALEAL